MTRPSAYVCGRSSAIMPGIVGAGANKSDAARAPEGAPFTPAAPMAAKSATIVTPMARITGGVIAARGVVRTASFTCAACGGRVGEPLAGPRVTRPRWRSTPVAPRAGGTASLPRAGTVGSGLRVTTVQPAQRPPPALLPAIADSLRSVNESMAGLVFAEQGVGAGAAAGAVGAAGGAPKKARTGKKKKKKRSDGEAPPSGTEDDWEVRCCRDCVRVPRAHAGPPHVRYARDCLTCAAAVIASRALRP